jgi:alpha-L-arabinofuranosidase
VQKLFSTNKGTDVVKILQEGNAVAGKDSLYASSVLDKKTNELIIKLVNSSSASQTIELNLDGIRPANKNAALLQLSGNDLNSYNRLDELDKLAPVQKAFSFETSKMNLQLPPYSVSVLKIPYLAK